MIGTRAHALAQHYSALLRYWQHTMAGGPVAMLTVATAVSSGHCSLWEGCML